MTLKKFRMATAAFSLFLIHPLYASEITHLKLASQSNLWLQGNSTLHPYASTATKMSLSADLRLEKDSGTADLVKILTQGKADNFILTIPVAGLKSGEKGLDKKLYSALKEKQFPEIKFSLQKYDFVLSASANEEAKLKSVGKLVIAGTERTIELSTDAAVSGKTLRVHGSYGLLMSDYGIKPPALFLGALKVRDAVVINYDLILERE